MMCILSIEILVGVYENFPSLGVTLSSPNKFHSVLNEVVRQTARSQTILNQHILRHPSVTPMHIFELFGRTIS